MDDAEFIRTNTTIASVPMVPEIRVYTAGELTPLWRAIERVPFWCVPWAGGQAVARWILAQPDVVRGKRVLDFGSGSGLVAIAAKLAGAASVVAVDVDPMAGAACALNAEINGVAIEIVVDDIVGGGTRGADVVLAGDIWYEREPADRFDAWLRGLDLGVFSGDPGRSYAPPDLLEVARYEVPTTRELEGAESRRTLVLTYP